MAAGSDDLSVPQRVPPRPDPQSRVLCRGLLSVTPRGQPPQLAAEAERRVGTEVLCLRPIDELLSHGNVNERVFNVVVSHILGEDQNLREHFVIHIPISAQLRCRELQRHPVDTGAAAADHQATARGSRTPPGPGMCNRCVCVRAGSLFVISREEGGPRLVPGRVGPHGPGSGPSYDALRRLLCLLVGTATGGVYLDAAGHELCFHASWFLHNG